MPVVKWNTLKATIKAINPWERIKRQLFIRIVMLLKVVIVWFFAVWNILQDLFEWESRIGSLLGLLVWLAFCYNYEMWMMPLLLLMSILAKGWIYYRLTIKFKAYVRNIMCNPKAKLIFGSNASLGSVDGDDNADKEEKSLKKRLQALKEVPQTVKNANSYVATLKVSVKDLSNFWMRYLRYFAISVIIIAMVVMYDIPLKYVLMVWGIFKFTRKHVREIWIVYSPNFMIRKNETNISEEANSEADPMYSG